MRIMLKPLLASLVVSTLIGGCAVTPHTEEIKYSPLQNKQRAMVVESAATYVREVTPDEETLKVKVSYVGTATLIDALREQLPMLNIMPTDSNVNLLREISIYANKMPLEEYMEYLAALTGYDISLDGNRVLVSSFVEKEWNLAMFSSKRNVRLKSGSVIGGGVGSGNSVKASANFDEWEAIVDGAEKIILDARGETDSPAGGLTAYVQSLRSVGTVSVGGNPRQVDAVNQFVKNIMIKGKRQVNISVQAYDIKLNDDRASGINWEKLSFTNEINGNPINAILRATNQSVFNDVLPMNASVDYQSSRVGGSFMLNFLNQFGEVELLNQPNITVRNGVYAYISTGEELSYVGEVAREEAREDGDEDIVSFKIDSVRVGVTLAVVPRILDDDRVLLDIWPVVSSKSGDFVIGDIKVPNLSLHDMSTQVIVKNGQSIQLGGFIRRVMAKKLQELPWREKISGMLVNPLFKSESNELERRELVLTVTPTIIDEI